MSIRDIRSALEARLNSLSPALATAWENVNYVPVQGTPWQRVSLMANPTFPLGLGPGGIVQWSGILQVSLFYPQNTGPGAAETRAGLLLSHFSRGLGLTAGSIKVLIEVGYVRQAIPEPSWYHVPVTIPWYSYI